MVDEDRQQKSVLHNVSPQAGLEESLKKVYSEDTTFLVYFVTDTFFEVQSINTAKLVIKKFLRRKM